MKLTIKPAPARQRAQFQIPHQSPPMRSRHLWYRPITEWWDGDKWSTCRWALSVRQWPTKTIWRMKNDERSPILGDSGAGVPTVLPSYQTYAHICGFEPYLHLIMLITYVSSCIVALTCSVSTYSAGPHHVLPMSGRWHPHSIPCETI